MRTGAGFSLLREVVTPDSSVKKFSAKLPQIVRPHAMPMTTAWHYLFIFTRKNTHRTRYSWLLFEVEKPTLGTLPFLAS